MADNYTSSTVQTLEFTEHIRKYPGVYIGSKDIKGLHHCIKEVVSNSIDEYLNGSGNEIKITVTSDNWITISDNARGIPIGEHSPGVSTLRACVGVQNTGGKYINESGEGGYNTSGGEHGIGLKAVNALSAYFKATTYRDGKSQTVIFERGKYIKTEENIAEKSKTGLTVSFLPDETIFETVKVDLKALKEMIREFSFLCSGLTFDFNGEKFCSKNGLADYLEYLRQDKELLFNPIYLNNREGNIQVEAIVGYTNSYSNSYKLYTNNIPQEKGTHLTGFKTAWTSTLNQWARDKKILKEKDENLTGSDYEEGQLLILNFKMIDPVFKGQNKEELSSSEGRTYVQKFIAQEAKAYFDKHEKDIKIILNKALQSRKAREAAKKAKEQVREGKKQKKKALKFDSKLADCYEKDRTKCEIYVTEGDSASGNLKQARNNQYQAVMPVRGRRRLLNLIEY